MTNKDKRVVILANGDYPTHPKPLEKLMEAELVVCCDGGADQYIANGYVPDVIVGDGDSLSQENRIKFADRIHYIPDQETNDQTKAVKIFWKYYCSGIYGPGKTSASRLVASRFKTVGKHIGQQ